LSESTPHEKGVIEHVVVISGALDLCAQGSGITARREGAAAGGDAYRNRGAGGPFPFSYPLSKRKNRERTRGQTR
jgi:hypothetical protein